MRVDAGMQVMCSDATRGAVADVIVDPVARRLTHIVVQPQDHTHGPRLVPISALSSGSAANLQLTWTEAQLLAAPVLQETAFLEFTTWPHHHDGWDVGVVRVLAWPIYPGYSGPDSPRWSEPGDQLGMAESGRALAAYDMIPPGTAELRRASEVLSSDAHVIGHVEGFVVGPDYAVTHVVLEHGHFWGHREVTIPIDEVTSLETDVVHLRVSRNAVERYPAVRFHRHHSG